MRNVVKAAIAAVVLGLGSQFAFGGQWGMVFASGLIGAMWLSASASADRRWQTIGPLFFAGAGAAGVLLEHSPGWTLSNFVLLLIAWDLDHFSLLLRAYAQDPTRLEPEKALINAHIRRIGWVAAIAWGLGMLALRLQLPLSFATALVLSVLVFLGLFQSVRFFSAGVTSRSDESH